jgi:hypothetical protein
MTNHPITPPPELMQQWVKELHHSAFQDVLQAVAQWGADQELEACCEHVDDVIGGLEAKELRAARRSKPPSLKQQSLALIDIIQGNQTPWNIRDLDVVRKILEALPDD